MRDPAASYRAGPLHPDRLFNEKQGRDPPPYRRMREARVYTLDELIEPKDAALQSYRREWLDPLRITAFRPVRVAEPSGMDACLSCAGGREVGPAAGPLLTALVPHRHNALTTLVGLARGKFRS